MEITSKPEIMIDEITLGKKLRELADRINNDYKGERLVVIGILKGSFMFLSDLVKLINLDTEIYFMKASSYGNSMESCGQVKITTDIDRDIKGENVLIVEDIIDSGFTMREVRKILNDREPKSLRLCSCLSKPSRRECEVEIEYLGFEIPDEFVVGYGLDYAEKYRNLPYIGMIKA